MDGDYEGSASHKALWRSASWSGRTSLGPPGRPPKPSRPLQPLSISRQRAITGWPCPASDDAGHPPPTPSSASSDDDIECSRVAEHVYLGSEAAARDREALRRHGITHVLNCVGGACPDYFRGELFYKTLWLHDSPAEDIASVFYDAFDYLEEVRAARPPGRVLVHCRRGASRSAAIVIAYLMWRHAQPFDDALRAVRAARAAADPNLGFASQLLQCQARVLLSPSSSGFRAYRMAPHSPSDPFHLVPKSISTPARLDSRGAFILHVPAAVFVWLGRGCDLAMAEAAASAARQVARYERARGPIVTINEGSEHSDFWSENLCLAGEVGQRRVELYDIDFEIFRRALKGEIVPSLPLPETVAPSKQETNDEEDGEPSSYTPSSLSAETASSVTTFSPASTSSSDGYNSSPSRSPVAELLKVLLPLNHTSKLPPLHPRKGKEKEPYMTVPSQSHAVRRSGSAPSFLLLLRSEMEVESDSVRLGTTEVEDDISTSDCCFLSHPFLFKWPGMEKVEEIHGGALDSSSVFMLLAPNSSSSCRRRQTTNILYVWLGRNSDPVKVSTFFESRKEEAHGEADWEKITTDFLDQMGLPVRFNVQVVEEGEEPEEFLTHLFSFQQIIESRNG
ncbi:protein-tyrosine-phosphatase MKP1-like [Phalaenopsis equestris]|uniref:protein-tyrosine-phosphatase MKP1-like n=1 Tax=Phalaenopsis equestris TaxID=78828 RepID=UPI0009E2A18A|nr:protein-tyrosine-phosphatase MKP1-like [Phalaenopsis equestris]